MQTPLTAATFAHINSFYTSMVAGGPTFAVLIFTKDAQFILPLHHAIQSVELFKEAEPVKEQNISYRTEKFTLPTLRVLTPYEHRCLWLANYFDVSVNDIQQHCKYDPSSETLRQYKLDYSPPELESPDFDQDLKG